MAKTVKMDNQNIPAQKSNSLEFNYSQENRTDIIYLEVDISRTEKRFRQFARTYNEMLNDPDFLDRQYEIQRQRKVEIQRSIKSLSIKSSHITTASAIIKAYFLHLKQVRKAKITKEAAFMINNKALAVMTGMSDRSVRRHLNKLLATGFIGVKDFRGTNASFILKINPEFLVARPDQILSDLLISQHVSKYPGIPLNPITLKHFNSLRPSFTDYPAGIIRTICPHIEIKPDTFNNNILQQGIVDNCRATLGERPLKLVVINNESNKTTCGGKQDNKNPEQTNVKHPESKPQAFQQKIRREKKKNIPATILPTIFFFTDLTWNFARSLLYDNQNFNSDEEQSAKHFIAGIFLEYTRNNNPRTLSQCYNEIITTLQIINDYTRRKIEWQLARPEYFFDPKFTGGFHRALKEWLPRHKEKLKKNKEWNSNKKLVARLYRFYCNEPSFERYNQCAQRLSKLKNKKFLDIFNTCVMDTKKFTNQHLNQKN